jgi:uncharacterized protein YkwD
MQRKIRLIAALVVSALNLVTGNFVAAHDPDIKSDRPITTTADTDPDAYAVFLPLAVKAAPPNHQPATPASPFPPLNAVAPTTLSQLLWQGGDPDDDPVTYYVTLEADDTTPDRRIYEGADAACGPGDLAPSTRYYWQVIAEDSHGATAAGPVWTFTTQSLPPPPGTYAEEVVALTNAERAKVGCPALAPSTQLNQAAQGHSTDMAVNDYFSHTSLDGRTPWDRILATGYTYTTAAENIAAGYSTPAAVVSGWMNSSGHRANILNCALTEIGVGYVYYTPDTGSVNYQHYWTQVFATPQ